MDYSTTLNLPKTDFSMKANLAQREPEFVKEWDKDKIYKKLREKNKGKEQFILHDGPPYANGHIHLGHTLNKVLKDIIVKYNNMIGKDAPYVPGWDCHGLPIELQVVKKLKGKEYTKDELRKKCREYAKSFVDIQREEFKRLGVLGDWENPYLTMSEHYERAIVDSLGQLVEKGYIYRALKPVYWCFSCTTALAEAEVEYQDHTTPSIYVKFELKDKDLFKEKAYWLIWTTTPWTLPGNVAICLHPDEKYVAIKVKYNGQIQWWLLAEKLVGPLKEKTGVTVLEERKLSTSKEADNLIAKHPFLKREARIVFDKYVTMDSGTGCVHIAPGHGQEDYIVGLNYNLPVISPVDNHGKFTEEVGVKEWMGLNVFKTNDMIIDKLGETGHLLLKEDVDHSYPHCWRCKKPIIFRSTYQWFMNVDHNDLRKKSLEGIKNVKWIPKWGEERLANMLIDRPDWCLSRQRAWGVPIPAFYCEDCEEVILTKETMDFFSSLVGKEGVDIWFTKDAGELLPKGFKCPKCKGKKFKKEDDILDVWFDSGVSHIAVLDNEKRKELHSPSDMYLEGSDQYRGWFQSSLLPSIALKDKPPYKSILTHGFTLDAQGKAMSKSVGNVVAPEEIFKKFGADILRLWVASIDYRDDMRIGDVIINRLIESYRKIRNTFRYILGNVNGFKEEKADWNKVEQFDEFDLWALAKLKKYEQAIRKAYENHEFHVIYHSTVNFCSVILSNLYFDVLKDRLYVEKADSFKGRSSRIVLVKIFNVLIRLLAPVLSFTTEDAWKVYLKQAGRDFQSIHLLEFDDLDVDPEKLAEQEKKWDRIFEVREEVNKALETAKGEGMIGHTLEAKAVLIPLKDKLKVFLQENKELLPFAFIVSQVEITDGVDKEKVFSENEELKVIIKKAEGDKCTRCWNYSVTVGKDKKALELCERCRKIIAS
ncbi:MAG: isoleucine--tRNA ligase [Spirochaetes bacterium]|nr:isoleucine--tRNA ligase [Spirochaetota bacterium]